MNDPEEETDLYELLNISRGASKAEIKKAYHKAALANHPDKVVESDRADADVKFKEISQAYEILSDDQKRHLYDTHGMSAFDGSRGAGTGGMGGDVDLDDILQQMFGMGMGGGGMPGMGGRSGPQRTKRGADEQREYEVTLEELYKGKTTKFASTKNVICSHCGGTGGKEKAKPKECDTCKGNGFMTVLRPVAPGYSSPTKVPCSTCSGSGQFYRDKDRCKKCKGAQVNQTKKILELYIPPGSREGEKIVLAGEGDQHPDQEPGDIIFELTEVPHKTFRRVGADLQADLNITLAEALTGFNRVVLVHLDGRGIQLDTTQPAGRVLRPDEVLKVHGEGMPVKRSDSKGDLFLVVKIQFPEDGWLGSPETISKMRDLLPDPAPPIVATEIDEVEYDVKSSLDEFGAGYGDPRGGAQWEDEDEEGEGGVQCAQQ